MAKRSNDRRYVMFKLCLILHNTAFIIVSWTHPDAFSARLDALRTRRTLYQHLNVCSTVFDIRALVALLALLGEGSMSWRGERDITVSNSFDEASRRANQLKLVESQWKILFPLMEKLKAHMNAILSRVNWISHTGKYLIVESSDKKKVNECYQRKRKEPFCDWSRVWSSVFFLQKEES